MGSLTPPWADELLARKTKVAKKMMSSLSTESYFEPEPDQFTIISSHDLPQSPQRFLPGKNSSSVPMTSSSIPTTNGGGSKVVDPTGAGSTRMASSQSPTSSATSSSNNTSRIKFLIRNTEKLDSIRNERDSMFDEDEPENQKGYEMTNGGEDLSILEYGPGIVKKLRSRYQSLALRQYAARPTLRRSASLENCLDAVSAEELAATLESKISSPTSVQGDDDYMDGISRSREQRGRKLLSPTENGVSANFPFPAGANVKQQQQNGIVAKSVGGSGPRGRSSGPDASARRDRMRRARSVDALHRTKREEEILEKFKHVVLPKEEIVIIEVSKPQQGSVINSANVFNQESDNLVGGGEKRFPTRLLLTSNNLRNTAVLDQQTATRVRNLISPSNELPPHDIVRETARIFEKNQENLNRRIGQALRLSKSHSTTSVGSSSASTSPPLTPPSPTPSTTNTSTPPQKAVTAQSSSAMQSQDKSFSTKTSGKVEANNAAQTNGITANGPAHGQKQIGIIKPTLSNSSNSVVIVPSNKITNGEHKSDRVRSPILSPIGFTSHKPLLQTLKPPLSPKPIFTSSPKVNGPSAPTTGGTSSAKTNSTSKSNFLRESPSTSPIIFIERARSISPLKSESPISRVNNTSANANTDSSRPKSPVSKSISPTIGERQDAFMRASSPLNGNASPTESERAANRLGNGSVGRSSSPDVPSNKLGEAKTKTVTTTPTLQNGQQVRDKRKEVIKEKEQPPPPPPRSVSPNKGDSSNKVSQLRVHQKQKSNQGGNGSMVFNFITRKEVPDYIEDDGLRRRGGDGHGDSVGEGLSEKDIVDSKIIPTFEGANVIINGRSSIQKRPKSQKLNISFNEDATTTYEYPSESSFVIEEEPSENENNSPTKPNVISGSSLGSYTPKVGSNMYQLGSYTSKTLDGSSGHNKKSNGKEDEDNELIEDYLKPNTESTTWSNEMSADILF